MFSRLNLCPEIGNGACWFNPGRSGRTEGRVGLRSGAEGEELGGGWEDREDVVTGVEVARAKLEGWGFAWGRAAERDCGWRAAGGTLKGERRSYSCA